MHRQATILILGNKYNKGNLLLPPIHIQSCTNSVTINMDRREYQTFSTNHSHQVTSLNRELETSVIFPLLTLGNNSVDSEKCYGLLLIHASRSKAHYCFRTRDITPDTSCIGPAPSGEEGQTPSTTAENNTSSGRIENAYILKQVSKSSYSP